MRPDQQLPTTMNQEHIATADQNYNALFYQNIKNELTHAIKSRNRWLKLSRILEIITHLLQGSSTIFVFLSAATNIADFGIAAGCLGISSAGLLVYSQYCKRNHEYFITKIQKFCYQIGIKDKLNYMNREITNLNNLTPNLRRKLENKQIIFNSRALSPNADSSIINVQNACKLLINQDIQNEFKKNIINGARWERLYKSLEVMGYIFQSTTGILAFIAFAVNMQAISILSGCLGVSSCILLFYSQNCKHNYEDASMAVQKIFEMLETPNNLNNSYEEINQLSNIDLTNLAEDHDYRSRNANILTQYNNRTPREIPCVTPALNASPACSNPTPIFY